MDFCVFFARGSGCATCPMKISLLPAPPRFVLLPDVLHISRPPSLHRIRSLVTPPRRQWSILLDRGLGPHFSPPETVVLFTSFPFTLHSEKPTVPLSPWRFALCLHLYFFPGPIALGFWPTSHTPCGLKFLSSDPCHAAGPRFPLLTWLLPPPDLFLLTLRACGATFLSIRGVFSILFSERREHIHLPP